MYIYIDSIMAFTGFKIKYNDIYITSLMLFYLVLNYCIFVYSVYICVYIYIYIYMYIKQSDFILTALFSGTARC